MSRFTKESLNTLPIVPDGKGGYRAMTKEEKAAKDQPAKPKAVKKPQGAGYFHGMTLEEICAKYSGGPEGIYIPGNVPSKKNGRGLMKVHKIVKEKPMLASGTLLSPFSVLDYNKDSKPHWERLAPIFREMLMLRKPPHKICFFFIRKIHNAWDYINMAQSAQDKMVEHGWIEGDDINMLVPSFEEGHAYDKNFPGVIIKVK